MGIHQQTPPAIIQEWQAYTPTLTWTFATPTGITTVGKYTQIGNIIFYSMYINATDSKATTDLSASSPTTPPYANTCLMVEYAGVALGSMGQTPILLKSNGRTDTGGMFAAGTNGEPIRIIMTGFYPIT